YTMEIGLNRSNVASDLFSPLSPLTSSTNSSSVSVTVSPIDLNHSNCLYSNSNFYSNNDTSFDYLNELIKEKFNDATVIISVVILVLINFIVIAGNILVILSVFVSTKLR